jgi:hypothetical protein
VFAGVLINTVESSEDTKVVRDVREVFPHEKSDDDTLINDIAIIKVGLLSMYEKQMFYVLVDRKHICNKVQSEIKIFRLNNLRASKLILHMFMFISIMSTSFTFYIAQ